MLFIELLVEVIDETILVKEKSKSIDIFEIITEAAGVKWDCLSALNTLNACLIMELKILQMHL